MALWKDLKVGTAGCRDASVLVQTKKAGTAIREHELKDLGHGALISCQVCTWWC